MSDFADFEDSIREFEQAWQRGEPPAVEEFLENRSGDTAGSRQTLAAELVCIDLEFRWRCGSSTSSSACAERLKLEDYLQRLPELEVGGELPLGLIAEEYRVRRRWGDRPNHDEYIHRFSNHREQIAGLLEDIDRELQAEAEQLAERPTLHQSAGQRPLEPDPRAPLPHSDYLLQKMIGAGGMGKVYRALQRSLERHVAVKFLRKSFCERPEAVERFVEEARTIARFRHPGIVGIHGLGRTPGGGYFIVMDLVDGPDLARILQKAPVATADAVSWLVEACEAVEHAHQQGVIHCDLKPSNLLLDADRRLRITDFGLARRIDQTATVAIEGTAAFMAPEQVSAEFGPLSRQTDVYGLGAVLYTLLTGRSPYQGQRAADVLARVVSAIPVVPPAEVRPEVSGALSDICLRCLAKSPRERYEQACELRAALGAVD